MTARVLIVDDHALFRQGVLATLGPEADFDVVAEVGSAAAALQAARARRPDLVLLDVHMPDTSGLALLPALRAELPDARIVILTVSEDERTVMQAIAGGAAGYLVKGVQAEEFLGALRAIVRGEPYVSPGVAGKALAATQRASEADAETASPLDALSGREREVLELLARGDTNQEIADVLVLSEKTVKRHVTGILTKLNARNRTEAARYVFAASEGDAPAN